MKRRFNRAFKENTDEFDNSLQEFKKKREKVVKDTDSAAAAKK